MWIYFSQGKVPENIYLKVVKQKCWQCTFLQTKEMLHIVYCFVNILSRQTRSAFAKVRCGVAPLATETGRNTNTPVERRCCTLCNNDSIESETSVLLHCDIYVDIRVELFSTLSKYIVHFNDLDDANKLCVILSGKHCINECGKAASSLTDDCLS